MRLAALPKSIQAALFFTLTSGPLFAQIGATVPNWTVPPYAAGSSGGLHTMTDFTPPRVFVAVVPCRVVDTRNAAGPYGGPALNTNVLRAFDIDNGPCAGIPAGVDAYSLSFGAIVPPADGFLTAWPVGTAQPAVSQLNFLAGEVVANAAIVPAASTGAINVIVNIGPTHVYIDINGYFSDVLGNPSNSLRLETSSPNPSFSIENFTPTCNDECGLVVRAHAGDAIGAWASGNDPSDITYGVDAASSSPHGLSAGVRGTGGYKGVYGGAFGAFNAAGVFGQENLSSGIPVGGYVASGVRGEGQHTGVLGISREQGIAGSLVNNAGTELVWGVIGFYTGSDPGGGAPPWGFFTNGTIGAIGTKYFLDPDPTDASRAIGYISLEGPEAGTYFRGRARLQNGIARIPVPEHFRLVTDPDGLTVQITPIGDLATVAVVRMDLEEIVVKSSRNVEFSYLVQGVRETQKHLTPFRGSDEFMPRTADSRIPDALTPSQRRRLILNGTYREDGTVNMETARRLGWDKVWERRSRLAPQPAEP